MDKFKTDFIKKKFIFKDYLQIYAKESVIQYQLSDQPDRVGFKSHLVFWGKNILNVQTHGWIEVLIIKLLLDHVKT